SAVSEDAWRKSEIVFKTEGGGYGHDNPVSASIAFPFKVNDYESCSYTIQNKKGVTVASGKGREVTAPFAELIKSGDPGIYQIQFIFKSASGHSVTLKRDFTITNSTAD
ncbi:MAG: hypothetical protein LBN35_02625, partial [Clostridiales Family XIII bacterium]|nr:hypothetical protein [Clostridiales Family XIII bacterium]